MPLARRRFLTGTGAALATGLVAPTAVPAASRKESPAFDGSDWDSARAQFALSDDYIHMSAMLVASHPKPVRDAIERHRRGLDADPVRYLEQRYNPMLRKVRAAAGGYLGIDGARVALTDSTTMGVGLVYNGLRLKEGQEILSTDEDYYVTHESIRQAAARYGATVRTIPLFDKIADVSADGIVETIARAVQPKTRVVAVTWVHSSTGLKIPVGRIAEALEKVNEGRDEEDRALLCVDGVHGFGIENVSMKDLGCDFLMAGCHKWLFGPRGTGIVAGTRRGWRATAPLIPSFHDDDAWTAWLNGKAPEQPTTAAAMMPGGFKPFEHRWALAEAFDFHRKIGRKRVAERTHALAGALKDGLAGMGHVKLLTPRSAGLSAGIVSFDVDGLSPDAAMKRLRARKIIASVAPYATQHVRVTPSIRNTPGEIEKVLEAVRSLA